mgnify:FL=1
MSNAGTDRNMNYAADAEDHLAAVLARTAEEVAHAECLDTEQRAEVYAILESMSADSAAHRALIGRWVNDRTGKTADA